MKDGKPVIVDGTVVEIDTPPLQPSKSLTVTSNGTVSITPDAPYDAMQKVDLTVNVAGSGGAEEYTTVTCMEVRGKSLPITLLYNSKTGWKTIMGADAMNIISLTDVLIGSIVYLWPNVYGSTPLTSSQSSGVSAMNITDINEAYHIGLACKIDSPNATIAYQYFSD